jgi:hypothetical protein
VVETGEIFENQGAGRQGDEPGIASIRALLNCWRTTLSGLRATGAASLPNRQVP